MRTVCTATSLAVETAAAPSMQSWHHDAYVLHHSARRRVELTGACRPSTTAKATRPMRVNGIDKGGHSIPLHRLPPARIESTKGRRQRAVDKTAAPLVQQTSHTADPAAWHIHDASGTNENAQPAAPLQVGLTIDEGQQKLCGITTLLHWSLSTDVCTIRTVGTLWTS